MDLFTKVREQNVLVFFFGFFHTLWNNNHP
jgi:hypothetical protein